MSMKFELLSLVFLEIFITFYIKSFFFKHHFWECVDWKPIGSLFCFGIFKSIYYMFLCCLYLVRSIIPNNILHKVFNLSNLSVKKRSIFRPFYNLHHLSQGQ
jgi:hypothetical protein